MGLNIDLGGGNNPRTGFLNVDMRRLQGVDHVCDFATLATAGENGNHLPFEDDSASSVVCSHCLEHVFPYKGLLHEIVRICHVGARVEVRVPHWLHEGAMFNDHLHTVPPLQVKHWCEMHMDDWWSGCKKRLRLEATDFVKSPDFDELRSIFWHLNESQMLRFIPNACSEIAYFFSVIAHDSN